MLLRTPIFVCVLLAGCTRSQLPVVSVRKPQSQPDVQQIAKTYRDMRAMTNGPVYVDLMFAAMCRSVTQAEVQAAYKASGPHAHAAVSIYMNDLAADVFGEPNPVYPVGSIIVKEKKGYDDSIIFQPKSASRQPTDGIGGMIKRPPGYDPAHGDWEYFYFEDPAKVQSGKINSCIQCHSGAAGTDYVFGTWARK